MAAGTERPSGPRWCFTVDGGDPRYFDDALARGRMPNLRAMLQAGGTYARGLGHMPSLTNPNNLSIVTGAPPNVHGISGNHALDSRGHAAQFTDPSFLRAKSADGAAPAWPAGPGGDRQGEITPAARRR